ncbi:MAG: hypothetical protein E6J61_18065 [Deltaproteobacteria bacterium]|nr:MAG: hypothetical protein E6J61_18065 [Deltaproteobacteria bacterium]
MDLGSAPILFHRDEADLVLDLAAMCEGEAREANLERARARVDVAREKRRKRWSGRSLVGGAVELAQSGAGTDPHRAVGFGKERHRGAIVADEAFARVEVLGPARAEYVDSLAGSDPEPFLDVLADEVDPAILEAVGGVDVPEVFESAVPVLKAGDALRLVVGSAGLAAAPMEHVRHRRGAKSVLLREAMPRAALEDREALAARCPQSPARILRDGREPFDRNAFGQRDVLETRSTGTVSAPEQPLDRGYP